MTVSIWRIAAVTPTFTADDLSGMGAKITGGRWNLAGRPVLYCSENISLALLETIAHLRTGSLPLNRYLVRIDVPDMVWAARRIIDQPPTGWDAQPHGLPSMRMGDDWCRALNAAVLQVPSVIVSEESNLLINPAHRDAPKIIATMVRKWTYDVRFF